MNKRNDKADITSRHRCVPVKTDSDILESLVLYVDKDGRRNGTVLQIPLKGNLKN
jgi:hypothetical protein